jgi:hypothetical protein
MISSSSEPLNDTCVRLNAVCIESLFANLSVSGELWSLMAHHNMTGESTELERIPLQDLQQLEEGSRGSSVVFLGEAAPTVSTSGRQVPTINWGEKRMSPGDLKVIQAILRTHLFAKFLARLLAAECLLYGALQGLKKQVESQGPWEMASGLLTRMFQQNMLDDFYRRQNDIIDSLMEVSIMHVCQMSALFLKASSCFPTHRVNQAPV